LPVTLAPDGHVGHPGHTHQLGPDLPTGEHRQVDQGKVLRPEPDHHHPAGRRGGLKHDRAAADVRQRVRLGQPFLHRLARLEQVGAGLEGQVDRGQPRPGLRPDLVQPGDAVEQVLLDRDRDELLDLGRGQAERLGLDLHLGWPELRIYVR